MTKIHLKPLSIAVPFAYSVPTNKHGTTWYYYWWPLAPFGHDTLDVLLYQHTDEQGTFDVTTNDTGTLCATSDEQGRVNDTTNDLWAFVPLQINWTHLILLILSQIKYTKNHSLEQLNR